MVGHPGFFPSMRCICVCVCMMCAAFIHTLNTHTLNCRSQSTPNKSLSFHVFPPSASATPPPLSSSNPPPPIGTTIKTNTVSRELTFVSQTPLLQPQMHMLAQPSVITDLLRDGLISGGARVGETLFVNCKHMYISVYSCIVQ